MVIKIILYLFFSVSGLVLIKSGSTNTSVLYKNSIVNLTFTIPIVVGLMFYVISFFLWIVILRSQQLSYIVSLISGLSYICIMISSVIFFHEKITLIKGFGIITILFGIMILNLGK